MTRPTDEQISNMCRGDVVTIRAVVETVGGLGVTVRTRNANSSFWIQPSEIMTIEPREIKVGDRVSHPAYSGYAGIVRHIEHGWAAISFDSGSLSVRRLDNLTVIP